MESFIVVNGAQFVQPAPRSDNPKFYLEHNRTEKMYVKLLHDSQIYFNGIKNGTIDISNRDYFIRGPQEYLDKNIASHIDIIDNAYPRNTINAWDVYVQSPVKVKTVGTGYVFCGYDGRHRYETARRYNLDILVKVVMNNLE